MFMSTLAQPVIQELREMVAAGAFGQLVSARGRNAHSAIHSQESKALRPADYWRRKKDQVGGGAMALIGIHYINLVQWLTGQEIVDVVAQSDNLAARELMEGDDVTAAVARLSGGPLAVLEASYSSGGSCLELLGTAGRARTDHWARALTVELDGPWEGRLLSIPAGEEVRFSREELEELARPLRAEFSQQRLFARAALAGERPPVTGEEGMRDVAVLEAVYRAAETGRRQRVEVPEI
jgi:predicted dehydrogenase